MKTLIHTILLLLCCISGTTQELLFQNKVKSISGSYVSFSVDNFDNIYLLSTTNQLKKLNMMGDSVSVFNDIKKFGEATLVDISNPLRILLYYKGFATIVVLDGMLNKKATIDLRRKNMFNVTAIGLSYDGKIWIYDEMDNTLKKIDEEGNVIFKMADFRLLFDKALTPIKIYDQSQHVYIYDSMQGVYVFDYYGTFKNKIDIKGWNHLQVNDTYIYGTLNDKIYEYNIPRLQLREWSIPTAFQNYKQIFKRGNRLYALGISGLEIYNLSTSRPD